MRPKVQGILPPYARGADNETLRIAERMYEDAVKRGQPKPKPPVTLRKFSWE